MVFQNDILAGASGAGAGYTIDQSIRFNDNDSAYLSRTTSGAGNRKTFTISLWFKRGNLTLSGGSRALISAWTGSASDSGRTCLLFNNNDDTLAFSGYATNWRWTTAVFRDPSAWYHVVIAVDTTQATADDRIKMYINGELQTSFLYSGNPSLNADLAFNDTASDYYIAYEAPAVGGAGLYDGYESEIYLIDGQALDPTDFGETNDDGVWIPKRFEGTYGTNGFYITGEDSADLGADYSGNGNDFTSSGLTSDDQVTDTPTDNHATLMPIWKSSSITLSEGNTTQVGDSSNRYAPLSIPIPSTGKWYVEVNIPVSGGNTIIGIDSLYRNLSTGQVGEDANGWSWRRYNGTKYHNNVSSSYGSASTGTGLMMVAVDADNEKIWFGESGTWNASGDPAAGTNEAFSGIDFSTAYRFLMAANASFNTAQLDWRVAEVEWAYTPPTGFSALSTANLTDSTITTSGSFTGNASTNGPFVFLNGVPTAMTINGNSVTFGTDADKLANGFKVRSSSSSYNASGSNTFVVSATDASFADNVTAQSNP